MEFGRRDPTIGNSSLFSAYEPATPLISISYALARIF